MISLPLPPLQSVSSVKYIDTAEVEQTVATSVYQTVVNGTSGGFVELKEGQSWPSGLVAQSDAVRIQFVAGYGATSAVPLTIKSAALFIIGSMYENREATVDGAIGSNPIAEMLIQQHRMITV